MMLRRLLSSSASPGSSPSQTKVLRSAKMIMANVVANNNKFWNIELFEDCRVVRFQQIEGFAWYGWPADVPSGNRS